MVVPLIVEEVPAFNNDADGVGVIIAIELNVALILATSRGVLEMDVEACEVL